MVQRNPRRIFVLAWLSVLVVACGGSAVSSPEDEAGGSGGDSGAGGTGGLAGTGGAGGDATPLIEQACEAMASLPCVQGDCEAQLWDAVHESISVGCEDEFYAVLGCGNEYGWECNGSPEELSTSAECNTAVQSFDACVIKEPQECSGSSSGDQCSVQCAASVPWGATCKVSGVYLACECNAGLHAGQHFALESDCSSDWWSAAESACR